MMRASLFAIVSLVVILLFIPIPVQAVETYLPAIDSDPPLYLLREGEYLYEDERISIYFKVTNDWPKEIKRSTFTLISLDDPYCKKVTVGFNDTTHWLSEGVWGIHVENRRNGWLVSSLHCGIPSDHEAQCQVYAAGAQTDMSSDSCGHGEALVPLVEEAIED